MQKEEFYEFEDRQFEKSFLRGLAIILVVSGVITMFVFIIVVARHYDVATDNIQPDIEATGNIGSFVGGVIGTIFSLAGVILLFITLRDQRESFNKERFEQRLFELIRMHRDNVAEFEIAGVVKGRACFKYMINELRLIYRIVEVGALKINILNDNPKVANRSDYLRMAYLIMFFGIGYSSERQLMEIFNEEEAQIFKEFVKPYLQDVQGEYSKKVQNFESTYFTYRLPMSGVPDGFTFETRFYPFDGHSSRLGHYFRLLFQTVTYIDKQPVGVISAEEKYHYAKNLRANLSNQEQLLFFYNSISTLGNEWIDERNNLVKRYALIKNIPLGVVDIGIHPHEIFGKFTEDGRYLFETDEILDRNPPS